MHRPTDDLTVDPAVRDVATGPGGGVRQPAGRWAAALLADSDHRCQPVEVRIEDVVKVYGERGPAQKVRRHGRSGVRGAAQPATSATPEASAAPGTPALDGVSLTVPEGSFTVLLGPSGSGKSTLLRCVAGTDRPTSGTIDLAGTRVAGPDRNVPPEQRDLSMVFQDYALWPHLTAHQNVAFALRRRRLGTAVADRKCQEILARLGLAHLSGRYPGELSGGEQQRVALARALVAGTGLLLCDEPLSNLDADRRERLRVEIALAARSTGATVLYITHDQAEAFALADAVGVLDRGRLVQLGTPEEVYGRPASLFVARFTGVAGELAGTVSGQDPMRGEALPGAVPGGGHGDATEVVEVAVAGGRLAARVPHGAGLRRGSAVVVAVRPGALSLVPPGMLVDLADSSGNRPLGALPATVLDTAYRGSGYDHVVALADGTELVGIRAPHRIERGAHVTVLVEDAGCFAYPGDVEVAVDVVPSRTAAGTAGTDSGELTMAEAARAPR